MMKVRISTRNGDTFIHEITSPPQETGGEGMIYPIYSSRYGNCYLKIYLKKEKAQVNQQKIHYLVTHPTPFEYVSIRYCWPIGIVRHEDGAFCGFMMEAAIENSRSLTLLTNYSIGESLLDILPNEPDWHRLYELNSPKGLRNRMRLLYNLARAIYGLHKTRNLCVVDLKPENIFVTSDGKISIIDMDSIQINTSTHFYKATAFTPNYFPAEAYELWQCNKALPPDCDVFAFGCCAYMVLTGTHPYTNVILKHPYAAEDYNLISSRIKEGLYLRGEKSSYIRHVDAAFNLHANYDKLPLCVRALFDQTFNDKHRPSMADWRIGLKEGFDNLKI